MLPKSRRALTIQEIAALARSSLHGKDSALSPTILHVTDKNRDPTACIFIQISACLFTGIYAINVCLCKLSSKYHAFAQPQKQN